MAMRWYAIHVYSGFEERVRKHLIKQIEQSGFSDQVEEILIPIDNVVEMKNGKRQIIQKNFFPGYVLIRMEFSEALWYLVKNTPKVTDFISSGKKPAALFVPAGDTYIVLAGAMAASMLMNPIMA